MDDRLVVVPDGVSLHPEKLAQLAELCRECWAEFEANQSSLKDPQIGSVKNLIASRIIDGAVNGLDDVEELRRALDGIL